MCLAIPGKIKEIQGRQVTVEYPGQVSKAFLGNVPVKVGDLVMVQMGVVVRKLSKKDADLMTKAWVGD